jgi:hypothetical protein
MLRRMSLIDGLNASSLSKIVYVVVGQSNKFPQEMICSIWLSLALLLLVVHSKPL